jgi:tetratricopeptide (TPR) repeat protein
MSAELEATADELCANCGKAAVDDDVKLKLCTACNLVKYCSVECQKNHRPQHKKACKKRAAEIREDKLFTQPDGSYLGECPICCLPLLLEVNSNTINSCCCKFICLGCDHANKKREWEEGLDHKCAFCREPLPKTDEEMVKNYMKRVEVNDPLAIFQMGGRCDIKGDYEGAVEYLTKAAGLGDINAHYNLSCMYHEGKGVEKDMKKEVYHMEEAAIGGNPLARFNLGNHEGRNGRLDRAIKHYIIAAKLGDDKSLDKVKLGFQMGLVSKDDYEAALRGHQAAVDATKSAQRDAAEEWYKKRNLHKKK